MKYITVRAYVTELLEKVYPKNTGRWYEHSFNLAGAVDYIVSEQDIILILVKNIGTAPTNVSLY